MKSGIDRDKIRGMFLGIAIGDALGMPVETFSGEEIAKRFGRITDYVRPAGHKWFNGREAGTWTDDTQLSLVVAESLIAKGDLDLDDMAARHAAELASGRNLGWGAGTREAVERLIKGVHWSKSGKTDNPKCGFGNGVAMKVAPIGAWDCDLMQLSSLALMTHYSGMAVASAFVQAFSIRACLKWGDTCEIIENGIALCDGIESGLYGPPINDKLGDRFRQLANLVASGELYSMTPADIARIFGNGTSYVYNSLPFSYAFFLRKPNSVEALYDVVNAGGDTDSNGSIVGALLGALNGAAIFPQRLIDGLWQKDLILDTAERFCERRFLWK